MVAGNTIASFLFSFGVSLDAGLVAGSTSLTLSLSFSHSPSRSLSLSLSLSLSPLPLPAPPAAMQLSPTGLAAYTLPHTGLQPFLSLPYAGVYTLPDNSVQGCLGLSVCSWQPHQPSFLQFTRNGHFFSVSCSSSSRASTHLSCPFPTPGFTPYWITARRGAWAFYCAAGNRTNHPH